MVAISALGPSNSLSIQSTRKRGGTALEQNNGDRPGMTPAQMVDPFGLPTEEVPEACKEGESFAFSKTPWGQGERRNGFHHISRCERCRRKHLLPLVSGVEDTIGAMARFANFPCGELLAHLAMCGECRLNACEAVSANAELVLEAKACVSGQMTWARYNARRVKIVLSGIVHKT